MIVVLMILVSLSGQTASPQLVVVAKDGKSAVCSKPVDVLGTAQVRLLPRRGPSRLPTRK